MEFSFIQITDHHLGPGEHSYNHGYATAHALGRVLDAIAERGAHGADFLVCTGDLANLGSDDEYAFARRFMGLHGASAPPGPLALSWRALENFPAYVIPGNHDPRAAFCRNLFPDAAPALIYDTSFVHKGVQFVCLDLGTGPRTGVIGPETLEFLAARLAGRQPSIVLMHQHPIPVGIPWLDTALPERVPEFWSVVGAGRVLGVLFGHTHATVERHVNGTPVMGLRSTSFQFAPSPEPLYCILPPHYRVVFVSGDRVTSEIHEVAL